MRPDDALHLAVEDELDAARVLQHAGEGVALVLPVVLIDDSRGKSDQRKNGACDQYGEPQTERQTAGALMLAKAPDGKVSFSKRAL